MNPGRLFTAGCLALITSAFSFMIRADIADPLATEFNLSKLALGEVMGAAFLGMAVAMLIVAPLCDFLGMGRVMLLAWLCHLIGILGTIFSPQLTELNSTPETAASWSYWILWVSTFLVGSGNGLVEIAINPLAATLYPKQKTHYLNILHAWWPGGLIMSGLLATVVINPLLGADAWRAKMCLLLVPLAIYGLLAVGQRFPVTERVEHNVPTKTMFMEALRPMFLIWAFCMLLTASSELGPNQWQASVLKRTADADGTLVLVYTSGLMFVMRFFAGPLAHRLSPVGMLTCASVLTAIGLYWLSYVNNAYMAFIAATVFGVGIAYYWPTMLGVTAERFPKGGALLLGLMGCFGNLAIWQALPQMGAIYDSYTVANLPEKFWKKEIIGPNGKPVLNDEKKTLTLVGKSTDWTALLIADRFYPAGSRKINPEAKKILEESRQLVIDQKEGKLIDDKKTEERFKDFTALFYPGTKKPPVFDREELLTTARKIMKAFDIPKDKTEPSPLDEAEAKGAAYAFRWVALLPTILIFIFGAIALSDRLRGGYKQVHIHEGTTEEATPM
jgi:MFS family permease